MRDILSKLSPPEGAVTKERRIGRGVGSGLGKTAGRGQKGQKARSKGNINKLHFQGGQTPMQRLTKFYRRLGAVPMEDWTMYRVTGEALSRLARDGGR